MGCTSLSFQSDATTSAPKDRRIPRSGGAGNAGVTAVRHRRWSNTRTDLGRPLMSKNDRDPRPNPRPPAGRELSYRSRRVAAGAARPVDLDDVTASPTAGHSGGRPVISNDGAILNPSDDAASPGSIWDSFDRSFRILTIDGGGGRGMIPAVILEEVERRSGRRISSMFHRMCGTSTGAVLACGLAAPEQAGSSTPRFRAREIVEIYRTLGAVIFSRGSFNDTVINPIEELLDRSA